MSARTKGRALWLPDIARDAGIQVRTLPGWEARGKEPVEWLAQVNHHTASNRNSGPHPSEGILERGRPDVTGPLCNGSPGRDGTLLVVAAGAANHPGVSYLPLRGGISSGVKYYALGWEIELDGIGEPFPPTGAQHEMVTTLNAAVATYLGHDPATTLFDHKAIARPVGRKIDVRPYDLAEGRTRVARRMLGARPPTPTEPTPAPGDLDMAIARRDPRDRKVWIISGNGREHIPNRRLLDERAAFGVIAPVPKKAKGREDQWVATLPRDALAAFDRIPILAHTKA